MQVHYCLVTEFEAFFTIDVDAGRMEDIRAVYGQSDGKLRRFWIGEKQFSREDAVEMVGESEVRRIERIVEREYFDG